MICCWWLKVGDPNNFSWHSFFICLLSVHILFLATVIRNLKASLAFRNVIPVQKIIPREINKWLNNETLWTIPMNIQKPIVIYTETKCKLNVINIWENFGITQCYWMLYIYFGSLSFRYVYCMSVYCIYLFWSDYSDQEFNDILIKMIDWNKLWLLWRCTHYKSMSIQIIDYRMNNT